MTEVMTSQFWMGLLTIIWINIILSGDNAVVIALAARSLPPHQQKKAVFWGAGAAVAMRIVLTIVAVELLKLPYLKLIGGALLLWIAVKLLIPEDGGDDGIESSSNLLAAIKTNSMAADHYRATTIAMNRIQEARTYPFEDVMRMNSDVLTWITENGVESDSPGNALFRRTTVVSYPADMTNTVEVVVSVILPQPFGRTNLPPVELRTMITSAR